MYVNQILTLIRRSIATQGFDNPTSPLFHRKECNSWPHSSNHQVHPATPETRQRRTRSIRIAVEHKLRTLPRSALHRSSTNRLVNKRDIFKFRNNWIRNFQTKSRWCMLSKPCHSLYYTVIKPGHGVQSRSQIATAASWHALLLKQSAEPACQLHSSKPRWRSVVQYSTYVPGRRRCICCQPPIELPSPALAGIDTPPEKLINIINILFFFYFPGIDVCKLGPWLNKCRTIK